MQKRKKKVIKTEQGNRGRQQAGLTAYQAGYFHLQEKRIGGKR